MLLLLNPDLGPHRLYLEELSLLEWHIRRQALTILASCWLPSAQPATLPKP